MIAPKYDCCYSEFNGGDNVELAERLKELRKTKGLTQKALAESIGITPGAIYTYEANRQTPNIQVLFDICEKYHVSADWLLGLDGLPEKIDLAQIAKMLEIIEENTRLGMIARVKGGKGLGYILMFHIFNKELAIYFDERNTMKKLKDSGSIEESLFTVWKDAALKKLEDKYDRIDRILTSSEQMEEEMHLKSMEEVRDIDL